MLENVEKMLWMLLLAPAIAPARNCSEPQLSAPGHRPVDDIRVGAVIRRAC